MASMYNSTCHFTQGPQCINSRMFVSEHISTVISSCAQYTRPQDSPSTRNEQQRPSTHLQICRQPNFYTQPVHGGTNAYSSAN